MRSNDNCWLFDFFFMTEAVRLGEMSVVIPFRYSRLLFSIAGILTLEKVNVMMLIGSALTILSGPISGEEKL